LYKFISNRATSSNIISDLKTKSYQEQQEWARHNQAHFIALWITLAAIITAQLTLVICCLKSACEKTVTN